MLDLILTNPRFLYACTCSNDWVDRARFCKWKKKWGQQFYCEKLLNVEQIDTNVECRNIAIYIQNDSTNRMIITLRWAWFWMCFILFRILDTPWLLLCMTIGHNMASLAHCETICIAKVCCPFLWGNRCCFGLPTHTSSVRILQRLFIFMNIGKIWYVETPPLNWFFLGSFSSRIHAKNHIFR